MERRSDSSDDRATGTSPARSGTVVDARTSLAIWLRTARGERGLSLEDVTKITKIQPRILERLESGTFEGLPADVFVRGFVRSFAKCVGLDEAEALRRYAQCGQPAGAAAPVSARALVDSMSELAPATARVTPKLLRHDPTALAAGSLPDLPKAIEPAETFLLPETGTLRVEIAAPPALGSGVITVPPLADGDGERVETAGDVAVAVVEDPAVAAVAAVAVEDTAVERLAAAAAIAAGDAAGGALAELAAPTLKKKRARRPTKGRGKRADMALGTPYLPSPVVVAPPEIGDATGTTAVVDTADPVRTVEPADLTVAPASSIELSGIPGLVTSFVAPVDLGEPVGALAEPAGVAARDAIEAAIETIIETTIETSVDTTIGTAIGTTIVQADTTADAGGTWAPKMPPLTSSAGLSWRRPFSTSTAPLVPSLVIDDADPDSAERELEDRAAAKDAPRRSFLPPILLDREDRSARQGGLTLAVIILLIAATLTLSYLMRRPGSVGDGVTQAESTTQIVA